MSASKNKKNGQGVVGGVLVIVLLVALVIFVFSLIQRPEEPPPPGEFTGLSLEALQEAEQEIQETEQNYPIAQILPYGGPFYNESFAIHNPRKDGTILIEIDSAADFETVKDVALSWISDQGFSPEDYDIQFKTKPF